MTYRSLFLTIAFCNLFLINQIAFAVNLPSGNSAYLYGKNKDWVEQIQKYNKEVSAPQQFRYLFPLVGKLHVSKAQTLSVTYDPSVTKFYKTALPQLLILANLSYWVSHSSLKNWSAKNYKIAADKIAQEIIRDPNADGVHLDIEIYDPSLLPFYQEISRKLTAANKWVALFASSNDISPSLVKALGNHGIIVLYGYDLHTPGQTFPVSPTIYGQRLKAAILKTAKLMDSSEGHWMVGVPAIATVYEWEEERSGTKRIAKNKYQMKQYFQVALQTVQQINSPGYLGYALWAFVENKRGQKYWPLDISPDEWEMMKK